MEAETTYFLIFILKTGSMYRGGSDPTGGPVWEGRCPYLITELALPRFSDEGGDASSYIQLKIRRHLAMRTWRHRTCPYMGMLQNMSQGALGLCENNEYRESFTRGRRDIIISFIRKVLEGW